MKKHARAWAEVAVELHDEGRADVACTDILERAYGTLPMPEGWEDSVRQEIPFMKGLLEADGYEVVLVNSRYFESRVPETIEEARLLLPKSNDSSYGIHFKQGPQDLVWLATLNGQLSRGAGAVNSTLDKFAAGEISDDELIRSLRQLVSVGERVTALSGKLPAGQQVELLPS